MAINYKAFINKLTSDPFSEPELSMIDRVELYLDDVIDRNFDGGLLYIDHKSIISCFNDTKSEMWYSFATSDNSKEKEETRLWKEKQQAEKERIENISLEKLSFRDLYQFPFHQAKYGSWVYDANSNFIFQFEFRGDAREQIIDILNGDSLPKIKRELVLKDGTIFINLEDELTPLIMIRGFGNLTGVGAYNLNVEYACKIQDTLAEYIVEKLKL